MKRLVDWYDHPKVGELDDWFEEEVANGALRDEYLDLFSGVSCIADFKYELERWVNNLKSDLDRAVEMLDEFEGDEGLETYEVEVDE